MKPSNRTLLAAAFVLWAIARLATAAEDAKSATATLQSGSRYSYRAEHSREGLGKFYMDREIAHVMGHQAADWLERPEREEEEKTDLLVKSLPIRPGDSV